MIPCDAPGVRSFRIDSEPEIAAPAWICNSACCHQIMELPAYLVARMKTGKEVTFTFNNPNNIPDLDVQITFPLAGFTSASEGPESYAEDTHARILNENLSDWLKKRG